MDAKGLMSWTLLSGIGSSKLTCVFKKQPSGFNMLASDGQLERASTVGVRVVDRIEAGTERQRGTAEDLQFEEAKFYT